MRPDEFDPRTLPIRREALTVESWPYAVQLSDPENLSQKCMRETLRKSSIFVVTYILQNDKKVLHILEQSHP